MGDLKCVVVQDLLVAYLDGEVHPETHQAIAGHLSACGPCRKMAQALQDGPALLQNLGHLPKGGKQDMAVLMAARRKIWWLGAGALLIISSLAVLTGLGMVEFFKASDVPLFLKVASVAGLVGTGIILTVLIVERIKEQRSGQDDFSQY